MNNLRGEVDMYVGGGALAAVGHYADQAAPQSFLATHNVTNAEAIYGLDIVATALLRSKMKNRVRGIMEGSTAYATGALVDRFLKGRFSTVTSTADVTPSTSSTSTPTSTVTGIEVMDPSADWGESGSAGGGVFGSHGDESASGLGIN